MDFQIISVDDCRITKARFYWGVTNEGSSGEQQKRRFYWRVTKERVLLESNKVEGSIVE